MGPESDAQSAGASVGAGLASSAGGVPSAAPPATRLHPPTSPGPVEPGDEGRIWPNLIGIALFVICGLGLLATLASLASMLIDFKAIMGGFAPEGAFDAAEKWRGFTLASYLWACALSLVVFWGAGLLLLRRRRGVHLLVAWSVLRVPYAFYAGWLSAVVQRDNMEVIGAARGATPASFTSTMMMVSFVSTVVFALAAPVFLCVWFTLPMVRRQVRAWAR